MVSNMASNCLRLRGWCLRGAARPGGPPRRRLAAAAGGEEQKKMRVEPRRPGEYARRAPDFVDSIVRVDHAGEYGAVRIYDGQLAVVRDPEMRRKIEEMRSHEVEHLRNLDAMAGRRRVRPTLLLPLWDAAGFALGAGSALLGTRAAMACTVAVEEAICEHYNDQLRELHLPGRERESELRALIRHNRDEEDAHREIGLENGAEEAPLYSAMSAAIKAGCAAAIWLSKRV